MRTAEDVIRQIEEAFGDNEYPGDLWILGSREGSEPAESIGPFLGRHWHDLDATVLDRHYTALSFFSEAGFRFFLPAFLVADIRDELDTADPAFHLVGGFVEGSVELPVGSRTFVRRYGGAVLANPRRYGASRFVDYARFRLSVFTREESAAIVSYLEYKRERADVPMLRDGIDAALSAFWRERSASAPPAASLRAHLDDEANYVAAIRRQREGDDS